MTEPGSKTYLLDTSAVFALIEDEEGAERVAELLRRERVLLPLLAALETYYVTLQERSVEEAERRLFLLRQLPAAWLDRVSDAVLRRAGMVKAHHRLSLADALIAGFALEAGAVLVHKDPEYEAIASLLERERLPYKGKAQGA